MDVSQLFHIVAEHTPTWAATKAFANSNFVTSFVGAGAGAVGGAWAAQHIAARSKARDFLLEQIGSANAGIELAYGMCNSFLNLKEQNTKPLKDRHDLQKAAIDAHRQGVHEGEIPREAQMEIGQIDYRTLTPFAVPYPTLQTIVFEKLSVKGRARPITAVLVQSIQSLDTLTNARNEYIKEFKAADLTINERVRLIFGLPDDNGNIDTTYCDLLEGMSSQADDCIFFSRTLCKDLVDYGENARKQFTRRYRGECPTISKPDFKKAEDKGLFPADDNYEDWITGFPKPEPNKPWFTRAREWLSRHSRALLEIVAKTAHQVGAWLGPKLQPLRGRLYQLFRRDD
jgi:hypothetical protein